MSGPKRIGCGESVSGTLPYSRLPALPWSVAVEMLNGSGMAPRDFAGWYVKDGSDFLAFGGARRPAAEGDRRHAADIEAGAIGERLDGDALLTAQIGDGVRHGM